MPTTPKYPCNQCGMRFPSHETLHQHKKRFCIGVKDSGVAQRSATSENDETDASAARCHECGKAKRSSKKSPPRRSSMVKVRPARSFLPSLTLTGGSPSVQKREEAVDWKQQRRILRRIEDIESRILTDHHHRTDQLTESVRKQDQNYNDIIREVSEIRCR